MNTSSPWFLMAPTLICFGLLMISAPPSKSAFRCNKGQISFVSKASLELIQARSNKLQGAIDPSNNTFAFAVDARSFEGFNSPLQREHFNENYMEYTEHPRLSFSGKIIETIDFQHDGKYTVRAKGKLNVHGVEQERIIRSTLEIEGSKLKVQSTFTVPLSDHNINIPRIVNQKIAEEVSVRVDAVLEPEGR